MTSLIDDATANGYALACGDCREVLRTLPDNSVDSIVTDPPYELGFMGKAWDSTGIAYNVEVWRECLRVLKPGGHLLAFGGSRTYHRLACAVEDAGFEIRDQIQWVYGSGFPKSLDVSKAIDKAAGFFEKRGSGVVVDRTALDYGGATGKAKNGLSSEYGQSADPITDAAREWAGWGTALKPAHEPIVMARKPLTGTVADNVLAWRTGAINVDACRVAGGGIIGPVSGKAVLGGSSDGWDRPWKNDPDAVAARERRALAAIEKANDLGRWPANLIHDGSDEVVRLFPNDAARFYYCSKAPKRDRDEGLDRFPVGAVHRYGSGIGEGHDPSAPSFDRNTHATVKPTDLMRYLCRLVTPTGGVVLDPFAGSGSTGKAAILEGFRFIGIELEADHVAIAEARIAHVSPESPAPTVNISAQVSAPAHKRAPQLSLFDLNTVPS